MSRLLARMVRLRALAFAVALLIGLNGTLIASAAIDARNDRIELGAAGAESLLAAQPPDESLIPPVLGGAGRPPLPVPELAPLNPHAPTPYVVLGTLEIPSIGLSQNLHEGVTLTAIDHGPSHWPGTAMPGHLGNVVIAGHRVTHSHPFYSLNDVQPGDELIITTAEGRFVYELVATEIVDPSDTHIVDQERAYTATLFGCHPRGSARQRIVGHFVMKDAALASDGGAAIAAVAGSNAD